MIVKFEVLNEREGEKDFSFSIFDFLLFIEENHSIAISDGK